MRKFIFSILALCLFGMATAYASVDVHGSHRKNGKYVSRHHRSSPDHTKLNNWSTKGNINPYTGKAGKANPASHPNKRHKNK